MKKKEKKKKKKRKRKRKRKRSPILHRNLRKKDRPPLRNFVLMLKEGTTAGSSGDTLTGVPTVEPKKKRSKEKKQSWAHITEEEDFAKEMGRFKYRNSSRREAVGETTKAEDL